MSDAVDRVIGAIQAISAEPGGVSVTSLAARLSISRPSSSRLLASLVRKGVVDRDPQTQRHTLSLSLWVSAAQTVNRFRYLTEAALPVVSRAVRDHQVVLNLSVLDGTGVVFYQSVEPQHDYVVARATSIRRPAHSTAAGKILLAHAPKAQVDQVIGLGLAPVTECTITEPAALRRELVEARERGYARIIGENAPGRMGLAAAMFDFKGQAVAALGAPCHAAEWNKGFEGRVAPVLMQTADTISRMLGHGESL